MSEYVESRIDGASVSGSSETEQPGESRTAIKIMGYIGAAMAAALLAIIIFEVVSRYFFNAPTYWATEISTYIVIGIVFLPLGLVFERKEHIRIEFLLDMIPSRFKLSINHFSEWISLIFLALSTWQMALYVVSEYRSGVTSWGLLSIPLWIPQSLAFAGLLVFLLATLNQMKSRADKKNGPGALSSLALIPIVSLGFACAFIIGNHTFIFSGVKVNTGFPIIVATCLLASILSHGLRMAVSLMVTVLAGACAFVAISGSDASEVGLVLLLVVLFLLLIGMEVALALGFAGLLGLAFLLPSPQLSAVSDKYWNGVNSFTYAAVPMFILMGSILMRAGITGGLFTALTAWTGRLPGGLAHATLGAGGIFAAFSGSSIATAATIGQTAGKEMISRGYSPRLSMGAIAGGGTLGVLIPPSIPLIIYGAMVGAPVTTLFAAGMIPGLMVMFSMMLLVLFWALLYPQSTGTSRRYSLKEKCHSLVPVAPFVALILCVFSVLYLGVATPTEAGAIGAAASALIAGAKGKLKWKMAIESLLEATFLTSGILIIVVGAGILGWIVDYARIPHSLVAAVEGYNLAPWMVLLGMLVVYIVLGMFIDPISMILMTVTMAFPIVSLIGYDAIWFGVALMMVVEVGLITPPVGIILFILRGVIPTIEFRDIVMGALPFVMIILLNLMLIAFFPEIVHWLPNKIN